MEITHPILGKLDVITKIGKGAYSTIFKAYSPTYETYFSLKVMKQEAQETAKEFQIQRMTSHPLIPQSYGEFVYQDKKCALLEYIEGTSLFNLLQKFGKLPENEARLIFMQLVSILNHLQKDCHVLHRDIKAENIIIDSKGFIHLLDFGFADVMEPGLDKISSTNLIGSAPYLAPETVSEGTYSYATELWSAGVLLYIMTTGFYPFQADNFNELTRLILTGCPIIPSHISIDLKTLFTNMFHKNPDLRYKLDDIMNCDWFRFTKDGTIYTYNRFSFMKLVIVPRQMVDIDTTIFNFIIAQRKEDEKNTDEKDLMHKTVTELLKRDMSSKYCMEYVILKKKHINLEKMDVADEVTKPYDPATSGKIIVVRSMPIFRASVISAKRQEQIGIQKQKMQNLMANNNKIHVRVRSNLKPTPTFFT